MPTITQLLLCLCVLGCLLAFAAAEGPTGKGPGPFLTGETPIDLSFKYLVSFPDGYEKDKTNGGKGWPLILFLHGSGQRGTNVENVADTGLPQLIRDGMKIPAIVVAPQCGPKAWWDPQSLRQFVEKTQKEYGCDVDRTYVTGLSLGGYGTWELITQYPTLFAAAAPVCGGGDPGLITRRKQLTTLPVWAFHGEKDDVVPVERTRLLVDALKEIGNPNVKMTIYPDVKHTSWEQAYREPELFDWLLKQKRTPTENK